MELDFPKKDPFYMKENLLTMADVLEKYEMLMRQSLHKNPGLKDELLKLDGKKLGCWCYPEKCHGDILKKFIEELKNK